MNIVKRCYCRTFQRCFYLVSCFLQWRRPEILDKLEQVPELFKEQDIKDVLLVTDKGIRSLGLADGLLEGLAAAGINCTVYDGTVPNPTIDNVEEGLKLFNDKGCKGIIAFGGGSSMDCAKIIGARAVKPNKTVPQLKGLLKVGKKLPFFVAVPTTAGTGSETTVAALVSNSKTHEKYAINDLVLIPQYAVLDASITLKLPPHITSTTGIDALTHAVESYIGSGNTGETKELSRDAVKLIFENLKTAYDEGTNIEARKNMLYASFYAGAAFTRAYVGYVHAVAHTLGGFYSVPHGLANAVLLPYLLKIYGKTAEKRLAELADVIGIAASASVPEKAAAFIAAIEELNAYMKIPTDFDVIKEEDIALMASRASKEANPLYPVPKLMDAKELENVYRSVMRK
ncbi:MAG: iron-containing alcohol dehydrogenase [Clostridiaceae bacterium]|nr:iron-containing alcohol dehydrogenase [Clostridiaceae bacterium]